MGSGAAPEGGIEENPKVFGSWAPRGSLPTGDIPGFYGCNWKGKKAEASQSEAPTTCNYPPGAKVIPAPPDPEFSMEFWDPRAAPIHGGVSSFTVKEPLRVSCNSGRWRGPMESVAASIV